MKLDEICHVSWIPRGCQVLVYLAILLEILKCGDIESNPGPKRFSADLDYSQVDDTRILRDEDVADVMEQIISIKASYYNLGRALRLNPGELDAIRTSAHCDAGQALNDVVLLWLRQNYRVEIHGLPTWRALVEAVDKKTGGNDHALAKVIAEKFPAGVTDSSANSLCKRCRDTMAAYYSNQIVDDRAWPPVNHTDFINLALIKDHATWRQTPQRVVEDIPPGMETVSYDNLFHMVTTLRQKFILLEGRPGSGKTFLVNKIVRDWANSKEILNDVMVLFISLQKLKFERDRSLTTLVRVACPALSSDSELLKYLVQHIEKSQGENVIFILDGLDEYQPHYYRMKVPTVGRAQRQSTISEIVEDIFYILRNRRLINSVSVVTSRPEACIEFRQHAKQRIEVLGFLRQQVIDYMHFYFKRDIGKARRLISYLETYHNMMNICFLPLHCAMLAFFYEGDTDVPTTETEFYKHFTLSTMFRSIKKFPNEVVKLRSFNDLPRDYKKLFKKLCKLAFKATLYPEYVFTSQDMKKFAKTSVLGLTVVDRYYMIHGTEETYSFQHMTLKDYLAAVHIAGLEGKKQIELINDHGCKTNLQLMWRFLCGMTEFPKSINIFKTLLNINRDILSQVYYAYETHHSLPCRFVAESFDGHIQFNDKQLSCADCRVIGSFINQNGDNSFGIESKVIALEFDRCSIKIEGIAIFLQCVNRPFSLELRKGEALTSFLKFFGSSTESCARDEVVEIGPINLIRLSVSGNNIGPAGLTDYLRDCLKRCTQIMYLDLEENDIGDTGAGILADGLVCCNGLTDLHLRRNNLSYIGIQTIIKSLEECKKLQTLLLWENNLNDNDVPNLISDVIHAESFKSLKTFGVWGNEFSKKGQEKLEEAVKSRNSKDGFSKLSIDASIRF